MATRIPPKESSAENDSEYSEDQIHVFLSSNEEPMDANHWFSKKSTQHGAVPRSLLGTINGLGTNPDESSCYVYNSSGTQTHVILKHRTPMVCLLFCTSVLGCVFPFHHLMLSFGLPYIILQLIQLMLAETIV